MNIDWFFQLLAIVSILMGICNLFTADFPTKATTDVRLRSAVVACAFFLLAQLLK